MFTGLVQATGTVHPLGPERMQIQCHPESAAVILQDLALGDSVAVDGVCLTVTECLPQGFVAAVSPETLGRTTLGQRENVEVNLELSLRVGSKLGGHFVTGHVDGVGYLQAAIPTETSWEMSFAVPEAIARYIVPKGSVTINGVSLTVAACNATGEWFKVAVIPHTFEFTNLRHLQPGSPVNLEGDILGKYVEKLLRSGSSRNSELPESDRLELITPAFLTEHGYL